MSVKFHCDTLKLRIVCIEVNNIVKTNSDKQVNSSQLVTFTCRCARSICTMRNLFWPINLTRISKYFANVHTSISHNRNVPLLNITLSLVWPDITRNFIIATKLCCIGSLLCLYHLNIVISNYTLGTCNVCVYCNVCILRVNTHSYAD